MKGKKYFLYFLLLASFLGFVVIGYFTPRTNFTLLISLYTSLFCLFTFQYHGIKYFKFFKLGIGMAILFRVALLFYTPNLSDDYYRFIWDGAMLTECNINPYELKPSNMPDSWDLPKYKWLLDDLNSKNYYSVYPPTSQAIFAVASWVSPYEIRTVLMKVIILLFEIGSIWLLWQLLVYFKRPVHLLFLYAFNPLVIIELTGNLHFEAVMIFFTLLSVWLVIKNQILLAAASIALAICTKLWPLIFIPFFIRRLGIERGIVFVLASLIFSAGLFLPFWHEDLITNFFSSVSLYFQHFAFNGSFFYLARAMGNTITWLFPVLTAIALVVLFFSDRNVSRQALFKYFMLSLTIYLLFATTVHPWYLTPLVAFMIFTNYRFPMLWAALIPFTYFTYRIFPYDENLSIVLIEYLILFIYMFYEFWLRKSSVWRSFIQKQALARAQVKLNRLQPLLASNTKLLDIGVGNGALAQLLKKDGHNVAGVDVVDKSLFKTLRPDLYDGENLPQHTHYDSALVITVLHHTKEPERVIESARDVANQIIIMEDVYTNPTQQYLTYLTDSLVNWEFWGHPYQNRTEAEWEQLFEKFNLQITQKLQHRFLVFFKQVTYVLEPA